MKHPASPRVVTLVGPQGVGKTTLFESLLRSTGAEEIRTAGSSSTDTGRSMTLELSVAHTRFLGEEWTFIDAPGAPEFTQEARHALMVSDAAVVVCDASPERAAALAPLFTFLDARRIPHLLFLNVLEDGGASVREMLESLQGVSSRPLVLREIPLREGGHLVGVVDLVSERAWGQGKEGKPALISLPDSDKPREETARRELIERLADLDDALLAQLLEDVVPPPEALYGQLERALREDRLVPVFLGSAGQGLGLERLLKGLRHEVPSVQETRERLGISIQSPVLAQSFKTQHQPHVGKLSMVRIWRGELREGDSLASNRVGGVQRVHGTKQTSAGTAREGEVVTIARVDALRTGELTDAESAYTPKGWPLAPPPVHQIAIVAEKRTDDVKLTSALARLVEEDPSLSVDQEADTQMLLLGGQGEMHLREAVEHLRTRMRVPVVTRPLPIPYRETIRRTGSHHARFKRQSGGHGQFGDVVVDVKPLPHGEGFRFTSAVVGGAVPRQYIPAVEEGVKDGLKRGPLGFPVVDVEVTLTGGTYHSVDSSDQAFRTTGRLAMVEVLPKLDPVLLEPILQVGIHVPHEAIPRAQRLVTSRRGQILGFDTNPEIPGWEVLTAYIPQAEMQGFIVELRSASSGLGSFVMRHDHYSELVGKQAERVVSHQQQPEADR
ncbi:elongation factor G [Archangium lansingense]|uniref:Elongation factor G n=1 Tax=Archangium lansingense TaxID=2995310 RepID=A0ABT4A2X0_9BACT|nr:elongation factor G [Archangium lansinium]MCY1075990.1 elongation factor G [Archangium lansinium]